jgi:hypothetical protein
MPKDAPIPPVGDSILEWRRRYPQAADELIRTVNLLLAIELGLVTPGANSRGKTAIIAAENNLVLNLPLKFDAPIANSTASAASVSTQLNILLAQLRLTGILPTG